MITRGRGEGQGWPIQSDSSVSQQERATTPTAPADCLRLPRLSQSTSCPALLQSLLWGAAGKVRPMAMGLLLPRRRVLALVRRRRGARAAPSLYDASTGYAAPQATAVSAVSSVRASKVGSMGAGAAVVAAVAAATAATTTHAREALARALLCARFALGKQVVAKAPQL